MRQFLIAVTLAAGLIAPAAAATGQDSSKAMAQAQGSTSAEWFRCFDLGWVRGVHLELWEMPGWIEDCLAGKVPFDLPPDEVVQKRQPQIH